MFLKTWIWIWIWVHIFVYLQKLTTKKGGIEWWGYCSQLTPFCRLPLLAKWVNAFHCGFLQPIASVHQAEYLWRVIYATQKTGKEPEKSIIWAQATYRHNQKALFRVLTNPSPHLHCHYFPFLVSSMLGCNPQLPLCVPHWVDHSHKLFFLFPLISLCLQLLPDMAVNLYKILDS